MTKNQGKNKSGEHFNSALIFIILAITISLIAFISEENKITGFVTSASPSFTDIKPGYNEYKDVDSLKSLAAGTYYIDFDGYVYWLDDESKPLVGKVDFVDEVQKNRQIYIDKNGNIGYLIS